MKQNLSTITGHRTYNSSIGYISKGCFIIDSLCLKFVYNRLSTRKAYKDKIDTFDYEEKLYIVFQELSNKKEVFILDKDTAKYFSNVSIITRQKILNKLKDLWIPEDWSKLTCPRI